MSKKIRKKRVGRTPASKIDLVIPTMSKSQYLNGLRMLGLTSASKNTANLLGVRVRQLQRFADGEAELVGPIVLLLRQYFEHGLPEGAKTNADT